MTSRARRAAAFAVAASLCVPVRAVCAERVILFLSDRPADELWLTAFTAGLNKAPGAPPAFVVQRALPDGDERLLAALIGSYSPAAVVSRQALTKDARLVVQGRGLPLEVAPPPRGDADMTAASINRALGAVAPAGPGEAALPEAARERLEFGGDRAAERALASTPRDPELLGLLVDVENRPAISAAYAAKAEEIAGEEPLWRRPEAYRLAARMWRELGERERADALFRRAVAADPEHLGSLRDLIDLRRERPADTDAAAVAPWMSDETEREMSEEAVILALNADAKDLDALRRLIERRIAQGRLRESAALTKRFLGAVPGAPSWMRAPAYREISRLAWDSGDPLSAWSAAPGYDRWALNEVRLRLRAPGGSLEYRSPEVEVAVARAKLGDPEGAERRLRRVLEVFPEDGHALLELFVLTASDGRDAQALALAGRVEPALSPGQRAKFLAVKAEVQRRLKDEAGARKSQLESLSLAADGPAPAPERAAALVEKARLQLELADEAGAEKSLRAALDLDGGAPALPPLLRLLLSQRRFPESLRAAERLVESLGAAPPARRAEALFEKARIQLELKDETGAEESLRESASLSAQSPALPLLLERSLARGNFTEALSFAERLEAAGTGAPPARRAAEYYRKARIQLELKDEAGAEKSLERSLSLITDGPPLVSLLHLTLTQGRFHEALSYAERLESLSAKSPPRERAAALVQKAQIQLALKDEAGAENSLRTSLRLHPDGPALPMLRHLSAKRESRPESAR